MAKYTKPLPLDEYDELTQEEKAVYISDMVDLLGLPKEPPAATEPKPPGRKLKTR